MAATAFGAAARIAPQQAQQLIGARRWPPCFLSPHGGACENK
jgi:hypothetical protein